MRSTASVTVIIVNWNSGALLKKCLEHLHAQTRAAARIIIVDNASSDGSAEVSDAFPEVTLRAMHENLGFAAGNNAAIAECDSDYIALLNPDAFPERDWLEQLLEAAHSHPEFSFFGSRQLCESNPEILDGVGDSYHISGLMWRDGCGRFDSCETTGSESEIFSPCAAAAMYRRDALAEVGGFDESFFCYAEDVDLGFRLRLAGHRAMYVPKAVVRHVGSATTGGQHSDFSLYHGHRNLVWTFVKNMPSVLFWLLLPLHLMMNLATVCWFTLQGKGPVICRAKRDAIKGLPEAWKKRKIIQNNRTVSAKEIWRLLDKRLVPIKR